MNVRRILSLFLSLIMVLTALPMNALAEEMVALFEEPVVFEEVAAEEPAVEEEIPQLSVEMEELPIETEEESEAEAPAEPSAPVEEEPEAEVEEEEQQSMSLADVSTFLASGTEEEEVFEEAEIPTVLATTSDPYWDETATDPYIIHAAYGEADDITQKQLYALLDAKWNTENTGLRTQGGFKYGDTRITDWADDTLAGLSAGTTYDVYTGKISYSWIGTANSTSWTKVASFKVVEAAETKTVSVANTAVEVEYNLGKNTVAQWDTFRTNILNAIGTVTVTGSVSGATTVNSDILVKFHHKHSQDWDQWIAVDEYLELNAANASEYDDTEDKATFTIGYGTATPATITVTLKDSRDELPKITGAAAESKDGAAGITSAALAKAAEVYSGFSALTNATVATANWENTVNSLEVGASTDVVVNATYAGDEKYKNGTVEITVSVTKSPILPATVSVNENVADGGDVVITSNGIAIGDAVYESANPLTVTVTPKSGNGFAYYVESITVNGEGKTLTYNNGVATTTFEVTNSESGNDVFTVDVVYDKNEISAQDVTVYVTGYTGLIGLDYDARLADYQAGLTVDNIKTGGPESGTYKVEMSTAGGWKNVAELTTLNGVYLDVPASKPVRLVWTPEDTSKYPVVRAEATATIKDSRSTLQITTNDVSVSAKAEADLEKAVAEQVKEAITIVAIDPKTGAETPVAFVDSNISYSPRYAWPSDGETATFDVTVRVNLAANATYANAPTGTLTLTCTDTTNMYTVTYVDGVGNTLYSKKHAENTDMPTVEEPTREYYKFDGWDKDIAATVEGDVTYTAQWDAYEYTIEFDELGGSIVEDITADVDSKIPAPAETTKEGHTFAGWFYTKNDAGEDVEVEFVFDENTTMPGGGIELTAKWNVNQYTITFDANGGTFEDGTTENVTKTQDYGTSVSAPVVTKVEGENTEDETTYSLEGWFIADENGVATDKKFEFNADTTMPAANLTLVAVWSENVAQVVVGDNTTSYPSLQEAIDAAQAQTGDVEVKLISNVEEKVTVIQKEGLNLTINGQGYELTGKITINGGSRQESSETLSIKNVVFNAANGENACIFVTSVNTERYSHNVTVDKCVFNGEGEVAAAIRTSTAGCVNWEIVDCTINEGMHSMMQVAGIDGLTIKNTAVYSKNGLNLNTSNSVIIDNCIVDVTGYAVRTGADGEASVAPSVEIKNSFLHSEKEEAVVIRGNTRNIQLTMSENVVIVADGLNHITGVAGDNAVYALDNNYWNGADIVTNIEAIETENYYTVCNVDGFNENLSDLDLYDKCVAEIDGVHYMTLQDAFDAAEEGDVVELISQENVIEQSATLNKDVTITLDLNGKTLTSGTDTICVLDGELTIDGEGTITSTGDYCGAVYANGAKVIIENGNFESTYEDSYAVYASTGSTVVVNSGKLTADGYGIVVLNANVEVNGGEIKGGFGISANGSDIYDDSTLTITGGTINGAEAGIYWPANGLLTIEGGKITGDSAVIVKSGSLNISGGELTANGENEDYVHGNSGATATGDALMIENVGTGEYDAIGNVSITGGTFISANAAAVGSYAVEGMEAKDDFISGGKFSSDVNKLCAENYKAFENYGATADGLWTVVDATNRFITVKVNVAADADVVTVNGEEIAKNEETGAVEFTSEPTKDGLTIVATPTMVEASEESSFSGSKTYVASVKIDGVEQEELVYTDYAVTVEIPAVAEDALYAENVEVEVTFEECGFTYDEDGQMRYYVGIETPEYETLYNAVITDPAYDAENVRSVKYLARPAATYPMTVPELFKYTIPLINYEIKIGGNTVEVDLDDAWLDVGEEFRTLTPEELQKQYDTEIQKIKDKIAAIKLPALNEWTLSKAWEVWQQFTAIGEELNTLISTLSNEAQYMGYHQFGASGISDEDGNATERLQVIYDDGSKHLENNNVIVTLTDDRIETEIRGGDLTFEYGDYTQDDILAALELIALTEDGEEPINGELRIVTDWTGKEVDKYTYTVYYDGTYDYKPDDAEFTLNVVKAPVSVDVSEKIITYGETYSIEPVATNKYGDTTNKDGKAVNPEMFRFIVGLDAADLDINANGLTGLTGTVQLLVPDSLKNILDMLQLKEGAKLSLSDLVNLLNNDVIKPILEQWGISSEIGSAISGALTQINNILTGVDLEVIIGGEEPTDIGVYLHGAVTVDKNYETAFDVSYLIIKADAEQVYLDWYYNDTNGIFTWELLQYPGILDAIAYDADGNEVEDVENIFDLFLGFNAKGEFVATLDPTVDMIDNGVYTQIAFIAEFGNEMYYAVPIVRAFAIVPNLVNVELRGDSHEANRELFKTFTNAPQGFNVLVTNNAGEEIYYSYGKEECKEGIDVNVGNGNVRVAYYGLQTNLDAYGTKDVDLDAIKASIESGDFKRISEYVDLLAPTTDKPVHAGAYVAVATYIGEDTEGGLKAIGADAGLLVIQPAKSTIVADDSNPVRLQNHLPEGGLPVDDLFTATSAADENLIPDYTTITANVGLEGGIKPENIYGTVNVDLPEWVYAYMPEDVEDMKIGDLISGLKNMVAENISDENISGFANTLIDQLNQIPSDLSVSFNNNNKIQDIGAYVVIGIVTDSDHYPSVDSTYLLIVPEIMDVELIDATGAANKERWFKFDGFAKEMDVRVTSMDKAKGENGVVINTAEDYVAEGYDLNNLHVNYIGMQTNANIHNSEKAPEHAGAYAVTAVYYELDATGVISAAGMDAGVMVIEPATSTIEVDKSNPVRLQNHLPEGGLAIDSLITATSAAAGVTTPDYTTITASVNVEGGMNLENVTGDVNVDLPEWVYVALDLTEEIEISVGEFMAKIEALANAADAAAAELGISTQLTAGIESLIENLAKLPENVNLTFHNNYKVDDIGAYVVVGIVTDSDHYPSVDMGYLMIVPEIIDVQFVDATGAENNDRVFEFDGFAKEMDVIVTSMDKDKGQNGVVINTIGEDYVAEGYDLSNLVVTYTGIQTNTKLYNDTAAPVHAGAYTATAVYVEKTDGVITAAGMDVGAMVIAPTTASVVVDNEYKLYDGESVKSYEDYDDADDVVLISASSKAYPAVTTPDVTIISAALVSEVDTEEVKDWEFADFSVNIDLPAWLDAYIPANIRDGADWMNVQSWLNGLAENETIASIIEAMGAEDYVATLTETIAKFADVNDFTFYDFDTEIESEDTDINNPAVSPSQVGVYGIVAIVTDSDHIPAVDSGLLVITPAIAEINFLEDTNDNNQFLRTYNGQPQEIKAEVTLSNGQAADLKNLTITYTGIESAIDIENNAMVNTPAYHSTVAPTETGAYAVTAVYYEEDEFGYFEAIGIELGVLVIAPAEATIEVENEIYVYDGTGHNVNELVEITAATNNVAKTVITGGIALDEQMVIDVLSNPNAETLLKAVDTVNVDLPTWMDHVLAMVEFDGDVTIETLTKTIEDILAAYQKAKAEALALVGEYDEIAVLAGALAEMLEIDLEEAKATLKNVDDNIEATLTGLIEALAGFNPALPVTTEDNFEVSKVGAYVVAGVVTDTDYLPAVDTGVVIITPADLKVDLVDANDNNQWLFTYGDAKAIDAVVTKNGELVDDTANGLASGYLTITYTGIQSVIDQPIYSSTEVPTETGAYAVTAVYYEANEAGEIIAIGMDAGVMVIQPAEAEIYVENEMGITGIGVKVNDLVHVNDDVTTTVITAGISLDGGEVALSSINGTVNIDMPAWLDAALAEYLDFDGDIRVSTVLNALKAIDEEYADELQKILDAAYEYNLIDTKVEDVAAILDGIIAILEQIPGAMLVEFADDITVDETGAYIVVGLITDSDYLPAHDIGLVVITPEIAEVTLVDANENNAFLRTFNGEEQAVEAVVTKNGVVVENPGDNLIVYYAGIESVLDTPIYHSTVAPTQTGAYAVTAVYYETDAVTGEYLVVGATAGVLVIEPAEATIEVADKTAVYGKETIVVNDLVKAESTTAANEKVATTVITGGIVLDEEMAIEALTALVNGADVDLIKAVDTVNVDVPAWLDAVLAKAEFDGDITVATLIETLEKIEAAYAEAKEEVKDVAKKAAEYDVVIAFAGALAEAFEIDVDEVIASLKEVDDNIEETLAALKATLAKFNPNLVVTTEDNFEVSKVGAYVVIGVVTDSDHIPAMDTGIAVITPAETVVDLVDANENNQWLFTFDGKGKAVDATVTINGEPITEEQYKNLTITYTGIQSVIDQPLYSSTTAPSETGAYAVTAVYYEANEDGEIIAIGMDLGVMVIQPAEAEIHVENEMGITGIGVKVNDLVHVADDVTTTVITAGISLDGGEVALSSINGTVNIDVPAWLDAVLESEFNFDGNVRVSTVLEALKKLDAEYVEELQKILDAAYDYNLIDTKVEDVAAVLDGIIAILEQIPGAMLVEFADDITVDETGAYIVVGLITDSDYLPAHDIGLVVITPVFTEVTLVDANENNAFFRTYNGERHAVEAEVTKNGEKVEEPGDNLVITYTGVQTDGKTYNSTVAPMYAGAYAVTAVYTEKDATTGEYLAIGATAGMLVIEPAEFELTMGDNDHIYDGEHKAPAVEEIAGNGEYKTVITAVKVDDNVNVNVPDETVALLKEVLAKVEAAYDAVQAGEYSTEVEILMAVAAAAGVTKEDVVKLKNLLVGDLNDKEINKADYIAAANKGVALLTEFRAKAADLVKTYGSKAMDKVAEFAGEEAAALLATYGKEAAQLLADASANAIAKIEALIAEIEAMGIDTVTVNNNEMNPVDVGEYTFVAVGYLNSDHYIAVEKDKVIIRPIEIEVSIEDATKIYGEDDPELPYTYEVTNADAIVAGDELVVTLDRVDGEDVGTYAITATEAYVKDANGEVSGNYIVTVVDDGEFTITKAEVTITVDSQTKVYGEDDPAVEPVVETKGVVSADELAVELTREEGQNVGEYKYIVNYKKSDNYDVTVNAGTLTITKAPLTVKVNESSKFYGNDDPDLGYTVTGLVNGDTAEEVLGKVSLFREAGRNVGDYAIVVWKIENETPDNYEIVSVDENVLHIVPAEITVTVEDQSKYYGDLDPVVEPEITVNKGNVNIDDLNVVISRDKAGTDEGENVGEYAYTATYTESENYNVTVEGKLIINALTEITVKVVVDPASVNVGDEVPEISYIVTDAEGNKVEVEGLKVSLSATDAQGNDVEINAITTDAVNSYTIKVAVNEIAGYEIETKEANLSVLAKTLKVTMNDVTTNVGVEPTEALYTVTDAEGNEVELAEDDLKLIIKDAEGKEVADLATAVATAGTYTTSVVTTNNNYTVELVADDEGNADGTLTVVDAAVGTIGLGTWRMELDAVVYLRYYPTVNGFGENFDFANKGGVVIWDGESAPTNRNQVLVGADNCKVLDGWYQDENGWYVRTHEIYAKNLGDVVYLRPFVEVAEGEYVYLDGVPYYSPAMYCYDMLSNSSEREDTRYVCAALLEYGASAQVYFGYETDNLVTTIPSKWPNIDLSAYDLDFKSSYIDAMNITDHVRSIAGTLTGERSGVEYVLGNSTLSLQGAIRLTAGFEIDSSVIDWNDVKTAKVLFWTGEDIAKVNSLAYDLHNYTYACDLVKSTSSEELALGTYAAMSHHIVAKKLSDTVFYGVYIQMNNGTEYRSGLVYYSPEQFVADHLAGSTGQIVTVCERIAVYGEMARIRFS